MKNKKYSSFDQINRDLHILKLQRDIDRETIKLRLHEARNQLYPTQLIEGIRGLAQKLMLTFIVKKIAQKLQ